MPVSLTYVSASLKHGLKLKQKISGVDIHLKYYALLRSDFSPNFRRKGRKD